jgi:hypothetical protein
MRENRESIWQAHVEAWKASGLSQRRYCEERGVSLSTFQWWRRRLRKPESERSTSPMVRVPVTAPAPGASELVVEMNRFRVRIRGTVNREQLEGLLDVLENR